MSMDESETKKSLKKTFDHQITFQYLKYNIKMEPTDDSELNLLCGGQNRHNVNNDRIKCDDYETKESSDIYKGPESQKKNEDDLKANVSVTEEIEDNTHSSCDGKVEEKYIKTEFLSFKAESSSDNCREAKIKLDDNITNKSTQACCRQQTKNSINNHIQSNSHESLEYQREIDNLPTNNHSQIKCALFSKDFRESLIHTDEIWYECDVCNKNFKTPTYLSSHKQIHTKPYQCDLCDKRFSHITQLTIHTRLHTGEKPFECDLCQRRFVTSSHLTCHKRTHTGMKPYVCEVCNKAFLAGKNLTRHKLIHTGEKPYHCDVCDKRFNQMSTLKTHKRIHTGEKPYECDVCSMKFIKTFELKVHKRTHTGEKPYKCDVCDKRFNQLSHATLHNRIHTGEKPYECDVCNKKFIGHTYLKRHKQIHTDIKMYECDVCQKRFSQATQLSTHKKKHSLSVVPVLGVS